MSRILAIRGLFILISCGKGRAINMASVTMLRMEKTINCTMPLLQVPASHLVPICSDIEELPYQDLEPPASKAGKGDIPRM